MLQIMEPSSSCMKHAKKCPWRADKLNYELGPGQVIEEEMAVDMGISIIRWKPKFEQDQDWPSYINVNKPIFKELEDLVEEYMANAPLCAGNRQEQAISCIRVAAIFMIVVIVAAICCFSSTYETLLERSYDL